MMLTGKIFENGRSQAVRLPKECRFEGDEVFINKVGEVVMLIPKGDKWASFRAAVDMFSDDCFKEERKDKETQQRESL